MGTKKLNKKKGFLKDYLFGKKLIAIKQIEEGIEFIFDETILLVPKLKEEDNFYKFFNYLRIKSKEIINILQEYSFFKKDPIKDLIWIGMPETSEIIFCVKTEEKNTCVLRITEKKIIEFSNEKFTIHKEKEAILDKLKEIGQEIESQII